MKEQLINLDHEQTPYVPSAEALGHPEGAAVGVFVELIEAPTRAKLVETLEARGKAPMAEAFGYVTDQAFSHAA